MIILLTIAVSVVLLSIGFLHLYWALGGRWGAAAAVPTTSAGKPLFMASAIGTTAVAMLLWIAALLVSAEGGLFDPGLPSWMPLWGCRAIAVVFLLRTVGELRWIGLFKKQTSTPFARWDTRLFTPLCFLLGAAIFTIGIYA